VTERFLEIEKGGQAGRRGGEATWCEASLALGGAVPAQKAEEDHGSSGSPPPAHLVVAQLEGGREMSSFSI
jgi:hypothetical protein